MPQHALLCLALAEPVVCCLAGLRPRSLAVDPPTVDLVQVALHFGQPLLLRLPCTEGALDDKDLAVVDEAVPPLPQVDLQRQRCPPALPLADKVWPSAHGRPHKHASPPQQRVVLCRGPSLDQCSGEQVADAPEQGQEPLRILAADPVRPRPDRIGGGVNLRPVLVVLVLQPRARLGQRALLDLVHQERHQACSYGLGHASLVDRLPRDDGPEADPLPAAPGSSMSRMARALACRALPRMKGRR